jgi:HEPN domain-containing protein
MRSLATIVSEFVDQWVEKAEDDLGAAQLLFASGTAYYGVICFHCQQAAEKFLKAFLVKHQIEFTKTHDIGLLLRLVERVDPEFADAVADARDLTRHAVDARYPEDNVPPTKEDAQIALDLAQMVRHAARAKLEI